MERTYFVGTYGDESQPNVFVYGRQGRLPAVLKVSVSAGTRPSFVCFNRAKEILYVVNEKNVPMHGSGGTIRSYRFDPAGPGLEKLSEIDSGGEDPCFLTLDPDERFLLCTNYSSASAVVFPLDDQGVVGEPTQTLQWPVGCHPHAAVFSPDGRFVYIPDLGANKVRILRWYAADGTLHEREGLDSSSGPGRGPRLIAFVPGQNRAVVVNEGSNSLTQYANSPIDGALEPLSETTLLSPQPNGDQPAHAQAAHVDVYGGEVYASVRGQDNLVRIRESRSEFFGARGQCPRFFVIDQDEGELLVAWQGSHRIDRFHLQPEMPPGYVEVFAEVPSPTCIVIQRS